MTGRPYSPGLPGRLNTYCLIYNLNLNVLTALRAPRMLLHAYAAFASMYYPFIICTYISLQPQSLDVTLIKGSQALTSKPRLPPLFGRISIHASKKRHGVITGTSSMSGSTQLLLGIDLLVGRGPTTAKSGHAQLGIFNDTTKSSCSSSAVKAISSLIALARKEKLNLSRILQRNKKYSFALTAWKVITSQRSIST